MKGNKKILVLLIMSLFLAFVVIGCAKNANEGGVSSPAGETEGGAEKAADDNWPTRPIRVILPAAAGGSLDVGVRQMQPFFEEILGVPFIVDPRPGGQNILAANLLAESEPDGYTIGNFGFPHTEMSFVMMDTDLTLEDFDCLGIHENDVGVLRVHDEGRFQTFEELLDFAIANPGEVSISVSQLIGPHTFYLLQLEEAVGAKFNIIDFGGGNPARTALLGKHVDVCCTNINASMPIDEGTKVIVVTHNENKWPELTDNAPTHNEVLQEKYGVTLPDMGVNYGLLAPAGFKEKYPERFEKLTKAYEDVINNPEYLEMLKEAQQDMKVTWMNHEEMTNFVKENYEMYSKNKHLFETLY